MNTPTEPESTPATPAEPGVVAAAPAPRRPAHLLFQSAWLLLLAIALLMAGGFGFFTAQCRDLGLALGWTVLFTIIGGGQALGNWLLTLAGLALWVGVVALARRQAPIRFRPYPSFIGLVLVYVAVATISWFTVAPESCRIHF
ncbi:hypothetical protein [Burkholderia gladioli]|uniref:hypothetical protein n=1 Tax=Burkholderia gladioli TaxID=28095 RepID=UPI0016409ABB|nr:hypothetical protein [Burkholderia gladioli]